MSSFRPLPTKDLVLFLGACAWTIAALIFQATKSWIPYPTGYGLNIPSIIWVLWSLPIVLEIIFGPFFLSILILHHWKSPFFDNLEEARRK